MISRPEITAEVTEDVCRLLYHHQMACLTELRLGNGRRLDVLALGPKGELWAVEVKSSVEDFRVDQKWQSYLDYCDRFYWGLPPELDRTILDMDDYRPECCGIVVADGYDGEIVRPAPLMPLAAQRRKSEVERLARTAMRRMTVASDPHCAPWAGRE